MTLAQLQRDPVQGWFWRQVEARPSGCWHFMGKHPSRWRARETRYGRVNDYSTGSRVEWLAHRFAYWLHRKLKPPVVMHRCDNPPCVRPGHLRGGTTKQNIHDAVRKGRARGRNSIWRESSHCPKGHQYTSANTRWTRNNRRVCLICRRALERVLTENYRVFGVRRVHV